MRFWFMGVGKFDSNKRYCFFFRFQIMLIHWIFKFDFQSLKVELFHFDLIQIELDSIAKTILEYISRVCFYSIPE